MRIRSFVSSALFVVSAACLNLGAHAALLPSDSTPLTSQFDVTDKTEVPGETLVPGHYSIRVLDHLSDRMVLQIENDKGKMRSTFLALPNKSVGAGKSGAIPYGDGKSHAALRGFAFEDGTSIEFVYPKAQAVSIAMQNSTKVPAIDPPSEGMSADTSKLSENDRAMVTLWLLSPTFVGKETKATAVLAQRYQAPAPAAAPVVAQNQPTPVSAPVAAAPAQSSYTRARTPDPQPVQMAQVTRKPVLAHLPHTAGSLPLIWLVGCLSLVGAVGFRIKNGLAAGA